MYHEKTNHRRSRTGNEAGLHNERAVHQFQQAHQIAGILFQHASKYSQSTGKPVKYVNKPSYRDSLTIGINFDTELKVTDKLKKEVMKGGIYKMGSNIFKLSHWNDTRENYEGVDVSVVKIINVR